MFARTRAHYLSSGQTRCSPIGAPREKVETNGPAGKTTNCHMAVAPANPDVVYLGTLRFRKASDSGQFPRQPTPRRPGLGPRKTLALNNSALIMCVHLLAEIRSWPLGIVQEPPLYETIVFGLPRPHSLCGKLIASRKDRPLA
jgi:hypothetical protein